MSSLSIQKGDGEEKSYFYTRNAQGDIIAIYRSEDSKLIGTYEYDLWGKHVRIWEAQPGIDTDKILVKNPFRYRGYYYDNETGFYNLNARYYAPVIRRFISADSMSVLMIATVSLECKNLFAYSENNPVTGKDSSGAVVESVFDIVTLAGSIVDVCCNPTDPWAWAGLAGDAVDLIPVVTGVGEGIKGAKAMAKVVDDVHDAGKAAESVTETAQVVSKSGSKAEIPLLETTKPITGKTNDHHIIPAFRGKSKPYADFIAERGIDVDQYTITVDAGKGGLHMNGIHGKGGWNQSWMQYIDDNPNATAKDIYQFAGKMLDDYGLSGYTIHPYGGK